MDNEEEKKVDTQTTEKVEETNANNNSEAEESKQSNEENQGGNLNEDTDAEVDIANAFGNKAEKNKNEGEKGKKSNSVAQTNADGSITFKNQEELNGFINRMYKKGAQQGAKQGAEQKTTGETQKTEDQDEENGQESGNVQVDEEGLMAKIALDMIDAGINAKKARKAARLVDINKVSADGNIDEAKLKTEIDEIIAEWPELKAQTESTEDKGFAFGGSQGNSNANSEDAEISKIFGNT